MLDLLLQQLVTMSARLGSNPYLVQAGGGNTSLKCNGALWIKASGKWLVNAEHDDMFVPVSLSTVTGKLETGNETFPECTTRSGTKLRPSVETSMHAVLRHAVVIHVHSVNTIAWACRFDAEACLRERLAGLRWAFIPYIHPGIPLARRIQDELRLHPDVLVLGNHGLVVGGDSCESAEALLTDVEHRLRVEPRPAAAPDCDALEELSEGTFWTVADAPELHRLGTDQAAVRLAAGGTLYPDHCVYLGPAAPVVEDGQSLDEAASAYAAQHGYEPGYLLVPGCGVVISPRLSKAGHELLFCLKRVVERIPEQARVHYIPEMLVAKLLNWDAEKYRLAMAQAEARKP